MSDGKEKETQKTTVEHGKKTGPEGEDEVTITIELPGEVYEETVETSAKRNIIVVTCKAPPKDW